MTCAFFGYDFLVVPASSLDEFDGIWQVGLLNVMSENVLRRIVDVLRTNASMNQKMHLIAT